MAAELISQQGTLAALLEGIADAPDIVISGIATDSRRVQYGDAFLACQGETTHGLEYLDEALAAGARAVVWDSATATEPETSLPLVAVDGLALRLGEIANRWFDSPSKSVRVTGVTGTNGKTTVAWLTRKCLNGLGEKCAYVGTVGTGLNEIDPRVAMTTPACVDLHALLADFRDNGAGHAAIEVSSHALEQARVDGVQFDSAIFTNLSRDHIDYHGSMQAYFESKASLFLDFDVNNRIVSLDSEYGTVLADRCGANVVTVSTRFDRVANGRPYVFVRAVVRTPRGSNVSITSSWGDGEIALPLPGDFNVANAAQVLALLLCQGVSMGDACDALGKATAPPGRMERVLPQSDELPAVFVDYSHTPASLEAALKALRSHSTGRLWCLFGCGGDRDRGKRALMGRVAQRLSDVPVVTSDNPRTEDPDRIIADVMEGMANTSMAIEDRGAAIAYAIAEAGSEDTILIAGKGHEDYQVIGDRRLDFSDVAAAGHCLAARGGVEAR